MPSVEVVGVHAVVAAEPCHLIEIAIRDSVGPIDVGEFTQSSKASRSEWQVPYDEHLITADGRVVSLWKPASDDLWRGEVRLAFFFHHLDLERPLITPFGEAVLPAESPRPRHLAALEYQAP